MSLLAPLHWVGSRGTVILFASLLLGLVMPPVSGVSRSLLAIAVFILLTTALMRVQTPEMRAVMRRPLAVLFGAGWILIVMPVVVGALAHLTGVMEARPALALSLVLFAASPPTISTPALSIILGLDATVSLAILLIAIIATPFTTPLLAELIVSSPLPLSTGTIVFRLALLILGGALAALVLRRAIGLEHIRAHGKAFDGVAVCAMAVFAFSIMDGMLARIVSKPLYILQMIALAFAICIVSMALASALFWRAGRKPALTIGFSSANRNMAFVVSALGVAAPPETWLMFVVIQFPIYLLPVILKGIYARLSPPVM